MELVEDFGIHSSEISCNAEVKADISSTVLTFIKRADSDIME